MKSIIALFFGLILSQNSFAFSNPQIRICHEKSGEFVATPIGKDNVGLCKLNHSFIGALDLVYHNQNIKTQSIENYTDKELVCTGTETEVSVNDAGLTTAVCIYADGSLIDLETLNSGRDDAKNARLNSALGL